MARLEHTVEIFCNIIVFLHISGHFMHLLVRDIVKCLPLHFFKLLS